MRAQLVAKNLRSYTFHDGKPAVRVYTEVDAIARRALVDSEMWRSRTLQSRFQRSYIAAPRHGVAYGVLMHIRTELTSELPFARSYLNIARCMCMCYMWDLLIANKKNYPTFQMCP